jgi:hypothetical protein
MFLTKKATSIVEAMVVLLIVVSWVVWMYQVFWNSQKLSNSTGNKIQAIQIAREGIEAMKNIRDTNWILFWSDTPNCWNVLDYNNSCVWDNSTTNDISAWSYKIYQNTDNKWKIIKKITSETSFLKSAYRNEMKVWLDSNWFFTQSWAITEIKPLFTREIKIKYLDDWIVPDNISASKPSNEEKIEVISLVQWVDNSSTKVHKVEFTSILTNWKK